jgi:hypothetical protein
LIIGFSPLRLFASDSVNNYVCDFTSHGIS